MAETKTNHFVRAWINLEALPGGMMVCNGQEYGPVGAMTSCCITTSETFVREWTEKGLPVLEIVLASALSAAEAERDALKHNRREEEQRAVRAEAERDRRTVLLIAIRDEINEALSPPQEGAK